MTSPLLMRYEDAWRFCISGKVELAIQALQQAFESRPPQELTDGELTALGPLRDDLFYLGQLLPDLTATLELARRFLLSAGHPLPHHG